METVYANEISNTDGIETRPAPRIDSKVIKWSSGHVVERSSGLFAFGIGPVGICCCGPRGVATTGGPCEGAPVADIAAAIAACHC